MPTVVVGAEKSRVSPPMPLELTTSASQDDTVKIIRHMKECASIIEVITGGNSVDVSTYIHSEALLLSSYH